MKVPGNIKVVAATLLSTLLVCLACRLFIFVPETKGLLSMGEPLFLASTLLLGPLAGAFVGGVGFALADFLLGYPHYAAAALTVKAAAGFVIGKVCMVKSPLNKFFSLASSLLLIIFFGFAGGTIYSGVAYLGYARTLFLGESIMEHGGLDVWRIYIPIWSWAAASVILIFYIFYSEYGQKRTYGWVSFSLLGGTLITMVGYLLYETFMLPYFFNVEVDAVANIPINFGQTILSAIIAILLVEMAHFGKSYIERLKTKMK